MRTDAAIGALIGKPAGPPTLDQVQAVLRDATDGICSNSAALRDLKARLFGEEPVPVPNAAFTDHTGEIGALLATANVLNELLREQRGIIDRLLAI